MHSMQAYLAHHVTVMCTRRWLHTFRVPGYAEQEMLLELPAGFNLYRSTIEFGTDYNINFVQVQRQP